MLRLRQKYLMKPFFIYQAPIKKVSEKRHKTQMKTYNPRWKKYTTITVLVLVSNYLVEIHQSLKSTGLSMNSNKSIKYLINGKTESALPLYCLFFLFFLSPLLFDPLPFMLCWTNVFKFSVKLFKPTTGMTFNISNFYTF